jgi:hypothetical protein
MVIIDIERALLIGPVAVEGLTVRGFGGSVLGLECKYVSYGYKYVSLGLEIGETGLGSLMELPCVCVRSRVFMRVGVRARVFVCVLR